MDQVSQMDDLISRFHHQTLDIFKLALLSKLIRGAKLAMADCIILNETNAELYKANIRKKKQADQTGKQHDVQGARHFGLEEVEWRHEYARNKQKKLENKQTAKGKKHEEAELAKTCKKLMHFGPDLLGPGPTPKKSVLAVPTPKPAHRTHENLVNPQRNKRKTVQQHHVQFAGIPVEN